MELIADGNTAEALQTLGGLYAAGKDVVVRVPTTDLPAEYRAGIPYGTKEYFNFPAERIHLFDAETEKNLLL